MPATISDIQDFQGFAVSTLTNGQVEYSMDELLMLWQADQDRTEIDDAIDRSREDVKAGRVRSAYDSLNDLVKKYKVPVELEFPDRLDDVGHIL